MRRDGETPLFDGLGSERTVTNTAGSVQGTLTTTAFGQSVASTGSSSDPYGFAATSGYRNDGDAGLMLVGARYYDAQTGSFISRDTHLDQLPYGYCNGDPVNAVDPSGHQWGILHGVIIGMYMCLGFAIGIPGGPPAMFIGAVLGFFVGEFAYRVFMNEPLNRYMTRTD